MAIPDAVNHAQKFYIYTLGKFYIRDGDKIISENTSRSKRIWEVFKYLLTNRGKSFFPEAILERIWPEDEYNDPNTAMRAQMFRLRQALSSDVSERSLSSNIVFSKGCYQWEDNINYWVDADEFESLAAKAKIVVSDNQEESIKYYQDAIDIYKGEYLPESSFSEWIVPIRSYYHGIYIGCVFDLIELFRKKHSYQQIIKLCEKAAEIDYFEEGIHIRLIEAMLAEGMNNRARAHYNEVTSIFYREMGVKPSDEMKKLYRLVGIETGTFELDLSTIQESMKSKKIINGAYFCDPELFRYFYKLEQLRAERIDQPVFLCLLTLITGNYLKPPEDLLRDIMHNLQDVIMHSLRKGDLVTKWNDAQFLLLLPGLTREQAAKVIERIESSFVSKHSLHDMKIYKKIESLISLESDSRFK